MAAKIGRVDCTLAIQLSGMGENPYEAVYHEYYHSLTAPYFPNLPVWVSEGLADLYGNSRINDKTASLGMPNAGLAFPAPRCSL